MFSSLNSLSTVQKLLGVTFALVIISSALGAVYYFFPSASNQGYAPVQPIPFSHKLHAGELKIDCQYCHTNVTKSRHATIPAMNICMNCHRVVKTQSPHIQKLTKAYHEGKPIEWIRVHELPDHVFFNHKSHVLKGVACDTCHGRVQEMERVEQVKPLEMGWCVQCHRGETTPKKVLSKIHPDMVDPSGNPVASVDCSTCHY